jgi:hypothetical protein
MREIVVFAVEMEEVAGGHGRADQAEYTDVCLEVRKSVLCWECTRECEDDACTVYFKELVESDVVPCSWKIVFKDLSCGEGMSVYWARSCEVVDDAGRGRVDVGCDSGGIGGIGGGWGVVGRQCQCRMCRGGCRCQCVNGLRGYLGGLECALYKENFHNHLHE